MSNVDAVVMPYGLTKIRPLTVVSEVTVPEKVDADVPVTLFSTKALLPPVKASVSADPKPRVGQRMTALLAVPRATVPVLLE